MNISPDQLWKHYGTSSKSQLPGQAKCWCLHCGISVKPEKTALIHHLQHCKTFLVNCGYAPMPPSEPSKSLGEREHPIHSHIDGAVRCSILKLDFTSPFRMGIIGFGCDPDTVAMYASSCNSFHSLSCLRIGTLTNHFDLVCGFVSGSKRDSEFLGSSLLSPKFRMYYRLGDMFHEEPLQRDHSEMQCVSILSPTNTRFTTAMRALEVPLPLFVSFRVDFTLCVPAPFVSQKTKPLHSSAPPLRAISPSSSPIPSVTSAWHKSFDSFYFLMITLADARASSPKRSR